MSSTNSKKEKNYGFTLTKCKNGVATYKLENKMEQKKVVREYTSEEVNVLNKTFEKQIDTELDLGLKGKPIFRGYAVDEKQRLQVALEWNIDGKTYEKKYPACMDCIAEGKIGYLKFAKAKSKEGSETTKWFMYCMNRNAKHNIKVAKPKKAKTTIDLKSAKYKKLVAENPQLAEALKVLM